MASIPRLTHYFRFYVKKRGDRRTGSPQAGSAGLTMFFAGLCAAGLVFFIITFTTLAWPEWTFDQRFVESRCTIKEKWVAETMDGTGFRPAFVVRLEVNGRLQIPRETRWDVSKTYFSGKAPCQEIIDQFMVDGVYRCFYDRRDPDSVVMVRGYSSYVWLILFLPGALILVGGGGVAYLTLNRAMSVERQKDLARRAAEIAPNDFTLLAGLYPSVPHDTSLTNSPGTRLAYRLPAVNLGGWSLTALVAGGLTFSGLAAFLVAVTVLKARDGEWNLPLLAASALFLPGAIWLLDLCRHRLNQAVHLGQTVIEISRQPLHPGAECRVFLAQFGRLQLRCLRLTLLCLEKATFQQGTNTRTESRQVAQHEIFRGDDLAVSPSVPLEVERSLRIPPEAMHSFRALRNAIVWLFAVEATAEGWPAIERHFPLVVYPAPPEASR